MFKIHVDETKQPILDAPGIEATLVSKEWTALTGLGSVAFRASYLQPMRVETDTKIIPIRDHVMLTRVATAALLLITAIVGRSSNDD